MLNLFIYIWFANNHRFKYEFIHSYLAMFPLKHNLLFSYTCTAVRNTSTGHTTWIHLVWNTFDTSSQSHQTMSYNCCVMRGLVDHYIGPTTTIKVDWTPHIYLKSKDNGFESFHLHSNQYLFFLIQYKSFLLTLRYTKITPIFWHCQSHAKY